VKQLSVFSALDEHGVEYVLVGAAALAAHRGDPQPDEIDLCYLQRWRNCECLCRALEQLGALPVPPKAVPIPLTAELRSTTEPVHLLTASERLALLPAVPGLGSYDDLSPGAQRLEVEGITVSVLSQPQLHRWREVSGRPSGGPGFGG
jgi:hypothetical protein